MFQRAVVSARRLAFGVVFLLAAGSIPIHAAAPTNTSTPPPSITPPPFRSQNFQDIPHQSNGEALAPAIQAPEATSLYPWTRLTFQSIRDNNWEIYTGNDDGSGQTRLTYDGATDMQPRLNRGATRLVFASKRTGNYEIFAMNADGSGLAQLTSDSKDDAGPYWSPDGSKIVFQAYRDGQAEIYVMNADGSGQTRLTSNSGYDGEPAWSPDGSQIAFVSKRTGGQSDYFLWVMNADGSNQHQLVAQPYIGNPAWSPDGSKIAFDASGADGWQNLWVANADGSYPYILFDEGGYADAWAGSWSPDSQYIAFTRIYYTVYNNQLYWTYAYLDACGVPCYSAKRLSATGMDWRPDWQITDAVAPTSSMTPLLAQSPSPFTVRWSAFDTGTSGLQQYDLQVRDGLKGTWADWNSFSSATTSASYSGVGGHTYYFRVRAKDNAGNMEAWPADYDAMTTVEALPPNTAVQALPKYIKNSAVVYWGGTDPGNSGIQA